MYRPITSTCTVLHILHYHTCDDDRSPGDGALEKKGDEAMHLTYRWQATLVIALGLLMAILDNTIVSVVLPQIARAFNTDFQTITWVGTGYFLATAAVIPIVGYLSDRIGTKTIFLIALALFTIGSGLCAFAPNQQFLIAFRVLQGIGGGAMLQVAFAIIFPMFALTERAG